MIYRSCLLFILLKNYLATIDGFNQTYDLSSLMRIKRQSKCDLNEFQCKDAQCISALDLCDGIQNCNDGSDETIESCKNYNCPQYTYKCAYGGCIYEKAQCDGKNDCIDNSDEAHCFEQSTIQPPTTIDDSNFCILPEDPIDGFLYVNGDEEKKYRIGDKVPEGTFLTFKCFYKLELYPNVNLTCFNRQWTDDVPKCEKVCDPIRVYNLLLKCYRDGKEVNCNPAFNGTSAKHTCFRHNEGMNVSQTFHRQCIDGKWDDGFGLCPFENGRYLIPPVAACPPHNFWCAEGDAFDFDCIPEAQLCDGKLDCPYGGDEIEQACKDFKCPSNKYRCAYGGCVQPKARCNGIKECVDNSDEEGCPPIDRPCIVPEPPLNGFVNVQGSRGKKYNSGDEVPSGSSISYRCKLGYELTNQNNLTYCLSGKWLMQPPKCEKTCEAINANAQLDAKCYLGENVVDCTKPFNQTRAKLKCAPFYEDFGLIQYPYRTCLSGKWDRNLPNCVPECGQKFINTQTLIIGGKLAKKDHWPWAVGVYNKKEKAHICGGSLLNQKVVLSAAHCFCDNADRPLPSDFYTIAVGKHFRQFNHEEDQFAQYSDVFKIFIPKDYLGADQNYRADIAVVILKEEFVLTHNVRPVCMDWGPTFESEQYANQKNGVVVGWGLTAEDGVASEELKELDVPYHNIPECLEELPRNYAKFATTGDKICGGYVNKSSSACQGDSGGGYVFARNDRYYIRGIVSIAPKTPSGFCDSNLYTLFTQVSKYNDFISNYESLYRPGSVAQN